MRSQVKWGKRDRWLWRRTVKPPEENNRRSRIAKLRDFKGLGGEEVGKKTDINVFFLACNAVLCDKSQG